MYAHKAMKSKAKYVFPYSVFDLKSSVFGYFDIILFLGVFYHLAHPTLALERLNLVLKKNSILILETEVSNTFTKFYHKLKFNKTNVKQFSQQERRSFFMRLVNLVKANPTEILSTAFLKIKELIWFLIKPFYINHCDIYKKDVSNFWIMDSMTIERILDLSGFKIQAKIQHAGNLKHRFNTDFLKAPLQDALFHARILWAGFPAD